MSQVHTEALLEAKLTEYGGSVERSSTVDKIEQDEAGVTVTLANTETGSNSMTEEVLRCKYIVGCDGAHSVVRQSAGLHLTGQTYPQTFILCDARLDGKYATDRVSIYLGRRMMALFPLEDGIVRIIGQRAAGDTNTNNPDLAEIQSYIEEMMPDDNNKLSDPEWLTQFQCHCRSIDTYRQARLFVAGDAAHIHSPAGGQGMNTGIQDAVNLGWKLGMVLRGEEVDGFLDSYTEERHPVGEHLLMGTDSIFTFVASQNPIWLWLRNTLMRYVAPLMTRSRERRTQTLRWISELAVKYRRSSLVGTSPGFDGPVQGSWRAPDGQIKDGDSNTFWLLDICSPRIHTVLIFSGLGEGRAEEDDLERTLSKFRDSKKFRSVEVVRIRNPSAEKRFGYADVGGQLHERYGMKTGGGFVVVRPDFYIEHIGSLVSLESFLTPLE